MEFLDTGCISGGTEETLLFINDPKGEIQARVSEGPGANAKHAALGSLPVESLAGRGDGTNPGRSRY